MPITMVNPPSKSKAGASLHALGGSLWTGRVLQTRLLWGGTPREAAQGAQATAPHPTTAERRRLGRPDFQPSSSSQHRATCGILAPFGLFMVKVQGRTCPLNHVEVKHVCQAPENWRPEGLALGIWVQNVNHLGVNSTSAPGILCDLGQMIEWLKAPISSVKWV